MAMSVLVLAPGAVAGVPIRNVAQPLPECDAFVQDSVGTGWWSLGPVRDPVHPSAHHRAEWTLTEEREPAADGCRVRQVHCEIDWFDSLGRLPGSHVLISSRGVGAWNVSGHYHGVSLEGHQASCHEGWASFDAALGGTVPIHGQVQLEEPD